MAAESLTKEDLKELINHDGEFCISIFLPTHPIGPDMRQDPIRLKNLLRKAEEELKLNKIAESKIKETLSSIYDLTTNVDFWEHKIANGLAIFLSDKLECIYRLPIQLNESVEVSDHFSLKQILPYFSQNNKFYILSLSQDNIKFLQCTPFSCKEIKLSNIPKNIDEILSRYQVEPSLQFRGSQNRAGGDSGRSAYHGHADDDDVMKIRIREYFNEIAKATDDVLKEESVPLVIAGVDYYIPIFKDVSKYTHILSNGIHGNPDSLDNQTLHEKALQLVKPYLFEKLNEVLERYRSLRNTKEASHQLDDIVRASYQGKIQTIFIDKNIDIKGFYSPLDDSIKIDQKGRDLLDYAATQTLLNNGEVFVLDDEEMPDEYICALFRF